MIYLSKMRIMAIIINPNVMRRFILVLIFWLGILDVYAQNKHDYLIFIGKPEHPVLAKEGTFSIDSLGDGFCVMKMTKNEYIVNCEIEQLLYGSIPSDSVQFTVYDEFNPPVWPDEEVELCILYKDDTLKDIEGYFCNSVWNDCRLFKTRSGEYVLDYKAYYRLINKPDKKWIRCFQADCQPIDLASGEYYESKPRAKNYKSNNVSKLPDTHFDKYYRRDGDKTYPTHGVPLDVFIKRYVRHMKLPREGIVD